MPNKQPYKITVDLKSEELYNWVKSSDKYTKKVRKILKWCYESYPEMDKLLELIKK